MGADGETPKAKPRIVYEHGCSEATFLALHARHRAAAAKHAPDAPEGDDSSFFLTGMGGEASGGAEAASAKPGAETSAAASDAPSEDKDALADVGEQGHGG